MRPLLRAWLTLPPSVNMLHGINARSRQVRKFVLPEVRNWQQEAILLLQVYGWHDVSAIQQSREDPACWYALVLRAWLSEKQLLSRDTDNFAKLVCDTVFNQYLAIDDAHICDIPLSKRLTPDGGASLVWIGVWEKCLEETLNDITIPTAPPRTFQRAA